MTPASLYLLLWASLVMIVQAAPPGWKKVWGDEFEKFDATKWSKGYKWGKTHNHRAYVTDSAVSVRNGKLRITASAGRPKEAPKSVKQGGKWYQIDYTSGAVNTSGKFSVTDAFVEARIKTSGVRGTWPAFWLLSEKGKWPPEIDIMENPVKDGGDAGRRWYYNFHYGADWKAHQSFGGSKVNPKGLDDDFHTYGMAWSGNYIEFYFDGKKVARYNRGEPNTAKNMYLILNLAVGGWGGKPAEPFPKTSMEVDWVRVYKWEGK
jgi:beta-glucanase (GH16 family)